MGLDQLKHNWLTNQDTGRVVNLDVDAWNELSESKKYAKLAGLIGLKRI